MVKNGALKLFRVAGVDVYIHWSWLVILYIFYAGGGNHAVGPMWAAASVALYIGMVACHEVVQLTCGRLVKGTVSEMYLSFLGRSSNLQLPQRPWPIILTYTGGILAYVLMLAVTVPLFIAAVYHSRFPKEIETLSIYLLVFNVILLAWCAAPVYPLDGGKVLQGLLWLFMSRKRSLQVACIIGIPCSLAIIGLAIYMQWFIWIISAVMIFVQCIAGFKQAKVFDVIDKLPRRTDVKCPGCKQHPFTFTTIVCPCGKQLDPFQTRGLCNACSSTTSLVTCPVCSQRSAIAEWFGPVGLFEVQNVKAKEEGAAQAGAETPQV